MTDDETEMAAIIGDLRSAAPNASARLRALGPLSDRADLHSVDEYEAHLRRQLESFDGRKTKERSMTDSVPLGAPVSGELGRISYRLNADMVEHVREIVREELRAFRSPGVIYKDGPDHQIVGPDRCGAVTP